MNLVPPSHICGPKLTRAARAERHRWINSLPETFSARQVANALGITSDVVRFAAPGRFTRIPQAVAPTSRHVSLPPVPVIEITSARPETAPRAGIVSTSGDDQPATVGFFMDYIRGLHAQVTAAAEGEAA